MTPAETKDLLTRIVNDVNAVGGVATMLAPQYAAFVAIGMAMDKQIPGLVSSVQAWIEGDMPTDEELSDHAAKLAVLSDPNAP